jgi:bacterioferritin-associated ferredoxin
MTVNRCVCHDVYFKTLIRLAQSESCSINDLADMTGATTGCGTCLPYLKLALKTGQHELPVMSQRDLETALQHIDSRASATPKTNR